MRVSIYRIKKPGRDLFRWMARIGGENGEVIGKGGPRFWDENDADIQSFLQERARRLARRGIFESVRVQMAN